MINEYIKQKFAVSNIDDNIKTFLMSPKPAIIYGAGRQARVVVDFLNMFNKPYFCLMTTDSRNRWGYLPKADKLPLYLLSEFPKELNKGDYDVIIAMGAKNGKDVSRLLEIDGYQNICCVNDWEKVNHPLRELYYKSYFEYYGARFFADKEGERYLECDINGNTFKMYFPINEVFSANTLGELGDIILPSLFGDERLVSHGSYEYGEKLKLHAGNVVLDLGASVGLFSLLAAYRGCKVYAFEPEQAPVMPYLRKNASLYDNITVMPYAVTNINGIIPFYYNDRPDVDKNLVRSSIHRDLEPSYAETQVDSITIDLFVKEWHIDKIDFIKSHTEYAEDYIMEGAKDTIKRDLMMMMMYSQKSLGIDRYKKIEEFILDACGDYKFEYVNMKVAAYVEKTRFKHADE